MESIPSMPHSLHTVDFSENNIQSISSEVFADTVSLRELILATNQISSISHGAFDNCNNLTTLTIVNNQLVSLHPKMFGFLLTSSTLESIKIELYSNPIDCSTCDMHEFQTFIGKLDGQQGYIGAQRFNSKFVL